MSLLLAVESTACNKRYCCEKDDPLILSRFGHNIHHADLTLTCQRNFFQRYPRGCNSSDYSCLCPYLQELKHDGSIPPFLTKRYQNPILCFLSVIFLEIKGKGGWLQKKDLLFE